jgi:hypothetical protein
MNSPQEYPAPADCEEVSLKFPVDSLFPAFSKKNGLSQNKVDYFLKTKMGSNKIE